MRWKQSLMIMYRLVILLLLFLIVMKAEDSYYVMTCKAHEANFKHCAEWAVQFSDTLRMRIIDQPLIHNDTWVYVVLNMTNNTGDEW